MNTEEKIRHKLKSHLNIEVLEVVNESQNHAPPERTDSHFRVLIVSKDFTGLNTVKRHQKVYALLEEELKGPVHAFSQTTLTPGEWRQSSPPSPTPPCLNRGQSS